MSITLLPIQLAINQILKADPQVLAAIRTLTGQAMAVQVRPLTSFVYVSFSDNGIKLDWQPSIEPTLSVQVSPSAFTRLKRGETIMQLLSSKTITFTGDMALGQQLQQLMTRFSLDWEGLLAKGIGDAPAHFFANRLRRGIHGILRTGAKLASDTSVYLQEEKYILPTTFAIETFLDEVDNLRDDGERLASRIQLLEAALAKRSDA